jgi:hypothetical protein
METLGIHTSAMLVELNVSCWTARKLDRRVSEEVDANKATKARAGNYNKNLMAGTEILDSIVKYAAQVRAWHGNQTLPWSDKGTRLLPVTNFIAYKQQLNTLEENFNRLVDTFIASYPNLVSAAAFNLGDLFNREDYPEAEAVRGKFGFSYFFTPVPTAGDFRIDVGNLVVQDLQSQFNSQFEKRVEGAMRDVWDRLHKVLLHMQDRLTDDADGERKNFHKTMLENANELIDMLPSLNITNDPKLEDARVSLINAIRDIETDDLKDNPTTRLDVRTQVDEILSKFEF